MAERVTARMKYLIRGASYKVFTREAIKHATDVRAEFKTLLAEVPWFPQAGEYFLEEPTSSVWLHAHHVIWNVRFAVAYDLLHDGKHGAFVPILKLLAPTLPRTSGALKALSHQSESAYKKIHAQEPHASLLGTWYVFEDLNAYKDLLAWLKFRLLDDAPKPWNRIF